MFIKCQKYGQFNNFTYFLKVEMYLNKLYTTLLLLTFYGPKFAIFCGTHYSDQRCHTI